MNKKETQTAFEATCFMHEKPQERTSNAWEGQQEDYIDKYAEEPK